MWTVGASMDEYGWQWAYVVPSAVVFSLVLLVLMLCGCCRGGGGGIDDEECETCEIEEEWEVHLGPRERPPIPRNNHIRTPSNRRRYYKNTKGELERRRKVKKKRKCRKRTLKKKRRQPTSPKGETTKQGDKTNRYLKLQSVDKQKTVAALPLGKLHDIRRSAVEREAEANRGLNLATPPQEPADQPYPLKMPRMVAQEAPKATPGLAVHRTQSPMGNVVPPGPPMPPACVAGYLSRFLARMAPQPAFPPGTPGVARYRSQMPLGDAPRPGYSPGSPLAPVKPAPGAAPYMSQMPLGNAPRPGFPPGSPPAPVKADAGAARYMSQMHHNLALHQHE